MVLPSTGGSSSPRIFASAFEGLKIISAPALRSMSPVASPIETMLVGLYLLQVFATSRKTCAA